MSFQPPNTTATTGFSMTSTPVAAAKPTFSFGSNAGGGDADNAKPLGFGLPAATTITPALGGGFLGAQPVAQTAAPPVATSAPAASFSFGAPTATSVAASTPAPALAPVATPAFGGFGAPPASTAAPAFSFAPAPTLAKTTAAATNLMAAPTTAPVSAPGGFASLSTATTTTASTAPTNVAHVSYNQLEEHINKWTLELEEQEKIFTEQATQINAWDKILISNNQKILELNDSVQKLKSDQQTLEQELEFIATQHKELEESIVPMQKEFTKIPQVDVERSQTYLLVENLDTQLKQMSEDIKEIIDNLNEANKGQDNSDPIIQIGKILNAHMTSLQWIEASSAGISNKIDEISKMHENFKRDSERSFRSAYYQ